MSIKKHDTVQVALQKSKKPMSYSELIISLETINEALETGFFGGTDYTDIWRAKHNLIEQLEVLRMQ